MKRVALLLFLALCALALGRNVTIVNPVTKPVPIKVAGAGTAPTPTASPAGTATPTPTPFDPTTIAGLKGWWKADAITTSGLLRAALKPGPEPLPADDLKVEPRISDGAPVATWPDSSGNGYNLTQATGANQPTFKTAIVNGKPIVRFNGTTQFLEDTTGFAVGPHYTYLMVLSTATLSGVGAVFISERGVGFAPSTMLFINSGIYTHRQYDTGPAAVDAADNAAAAVGAFVILTCDWDGSNIHIWRNSTLKATTAITTLYNAGIANDTVVGIDIPDGYIFPYNGDIAEILVYQSVLSTTDRQNVENYLKAKYATP